MQSLLPVWSASRPPTLAAPPSQRPARQTLEGFLNPAVSDAAWPAWWPVVAYLARVLRLADQRATSEYGREE
jgi:hypothetical protein